MTAQEVLHRLSCEDAIAFVCDATWGFAEMDAQGRFVWLNRSYAEILSAPVDLILGTSYSDWTHPEDVGIDKQLAQQVADGTIPGYTLAKRYLQRGSTPQNPRVIWGMLSVSGKWLQTKEFAGYRVQFQPWQSGQDVPQKRWKDLKEVAKWTAANWKMLVTAVAVLTSLIASGSATLSDISRETKATVESVESVLQSLPSGASPPPESP